MTLNIEGESKLSDGGISIIAQSIVDMTSTDMRFSVEKELDGEHGADKSHQESIGINGLIAWLWSSIDELVLLVIVILFLHRNRNNVYGMYRDHY